MSGLFHRTLQVAVLHARNRSSKLVTVTLFEKAAAAVDTGGASRYDLTDGHANKVHDSCCAVGRRRSGTGAR